MYILYCWLSLAYLFIFILSNGLRLILNGYYKAFDKFVSVYNYFGYLLPTVIFILNSFCFRGGIMKIFGIICMSIMLGIAFVDMVAVFTNFVEKSKKEWVKNFFIILQMIFLVVFLCVTIIGIITLF